MAKEINKERCIKPDNYIVLQGWMITELELSGNELLVYAIIYGFSQTGNQNFTGSRQYLADWTNSSLSTVQRALNSLCEKGLLKKEEQQKQGAQKDCFYTAIRPEIASVKMTPGECQNDSRASVKMTPGECQNDSRASVKMTHNNIDNNSSNILAYKTSNTIITGKPELDEAIEQYKEFRKKIKKPMTDRAIELLIKKLDSMSNNTDEQIAILNQSILNGWQGIFTLKNNTPVQAAGYGNRPQYNAAPATHSGGFNDLDDLF